MSLIMRANGSYNGDFHRRAMMGSAMRACGRGPPGRGELAERLSPTPSPKARPAMPAARHWFAVYLVTDGQAAHTAPLTSRVEATARAEVINALLPEDGIPVRVEKFRALVSLPARLAPQRCVAGGSRPSKYKAPSSRPLSDQPTTEHLPARTDPESP
jgi:hypothetical protein